MLTTHTTQKARFNHGVSPNDHTIIHNFANRGVMTSKPFSTSSSHQYASTNALQCHSHLHVQSRRPSRTREFTISTSRDLIRFAVKPFHLRFTSNCFSSISNNYAKDILHFEPMGEYSMHTHKFSFKLLLIITLFSLPQIAWKVMNKIIFKQQSTIGFGYHTTSFRASKVHAAHYLSP
jgi:hypothetical protein